MGFFSWYMVVTASIFTFWFLEAACGHSIYRSIKRSQFTKALKRERSAQINKVTPLANIVKVAGGHQQFIKVGNKFLKVSTSMDSFPWSLSDVPHNIPHETDTHKFILYAEANDIQHNYNSVTITKGNN